MFTAKTSSLKQSGVLNNLINDYLDKKETLNPFYDHYPDKEGFTDFLKVDKYPSLNRETLSAILLKQTATVSNTSDKTKNNIHLLKHKDCYTITTGHQLCLFTGPLYFIYKIISAINLAEELNQLFPTQKFVPVYWAATEDHDFEEVNHIHVFGKKISWQSSQTGAVGAFKTKELQALLPSLKEAIGSGINAEELIQLFEKTYLQHETLRDATRFLVNELFGEFGLITIDGNDKELKQQFISQFKKDIFENRAYSCVTKSVDALHTLGYQAQVKPREINCFYMEAGIRARIEKEGEVFRIIGTEKTFSPEQLKNMIETEPEKISPNVVLRPLYQQTILPNVAYVGGPGELSYWLEYKNMFEDFIAVFPVLIPRAFITLIEKNIKTKIDKLRFTIEDVFKEEQELITLFQVKSNTLFTLNNEKEEMERLFTEITGKINLVDKTLVNNVAAEKQKSINSLDNLVNKANRAIKQKSETEINQVKTIKEKLFPNKIPQERFDNFSTFYIKWGKSFVKTLKEYINVLKKEHLALIEE
ncbi:MAG: bacillithiol biosynthesis cysteine-adding enzyme BshC [Bacteroidetes bacterium]|nr:bacillithiol biosynthesis cysteine-adding enzyme BshC [Bacteroidota bacterium]